MLILFMHLARNGLEMLLGARGRALRARPRAPLLVLLLRCVHQSCICLDVDLGACREHLERCPMRANILEKSGAQIDRATNEIPRASSSCTLGVHMRLAWYDACA